MCGLLADRRRRWRLYWWCGWLNRRCRRKGGRPDKDIWREAERARKIRSGLRAFSDACGFLRFGIFEVLAIFRTVSDATESGDRLRLHRGTVSGKRGRSKGVELTDVHRLAAGCRSPANEHLI